MSGIAGDSAAIGAGTIGRSGTIPGTCCSRRSGAARNRTTFRPMSGRENGTRRTVTIGVTNADARDHVGETDAQTRYRGRCRHRPAPGSTADDGRHRNACRLAARPRESRPKDANILRTVRLRTHPLRSAPSWMALGQMGLPLSARLPDRLLLCVPAGSARLWPMRLLAVSAVLTPPLGASTHLRNL